MSQISTVNFSDVSVAKRFDAEFFKQDYLKIYDKLTSNDHILFEDIAFITDGIHSSIDFDEDSDVLLVSAKAPKENFFDLSGLQHISKSQHKLNPRTALQEGDVILSTVGTIGNCAVVTSDVLPANSDRHVGIIRSQKVSPFFLSAFLLSKYGRAQTSRNIVGNVQPNLYIRDMKKFILPVLSNGFQKKIEIIVKDAYRANKESVEILNSASDLLLDELNLNDLSSLLHNLVFETTNKNVRKVARFDAEFFQPKYAEIVKAVESYSGGWETLKDLTTYISNGNQPPYSNTGKIRFFSQKWIKDKWIDYNFLESKDEPMVEKKFFEEKKNRESLVNYGDILYYSVGANLGFCHNYLEKEPIAVGSFINIIRADKAKINELYLGFVLNSVVGRMQGDRDKSGIAQPYIYAKNLRGFKIPLVSESIQKKIAQKVLEAHNTRKKAKTLLDDAKSKIEREFEKM